MNKTKKANSTGVDIFCAIRNNLYSIVFHLCLSVLCYPLMWTLYYAGFSHWMLFAAIISMAYIAGGFIFLQPCGTAPPLSVLALLSLLVLPVYSLLSLEAGESATSFVLLSDAIPMPYLINPALVVAATEIGWCNFSSHVLVLTDAFISALCPPLFLLMGYMLKRATRKKGWDMLVSRNG